MINRIILLILTGLVLTLHAQDLQKEIASLEKDFKSFEYKKVLQKGQFLLTDTYTTKEDSLQIFQYMLSASYALNDSIKAQSIIYDILRSQPTFSLNPKNTSPKIVEFFNLIKDGLVQEPGKSIQDSLEYSTQKRLKHFSNTQLISGILFPGSAHIMAGNSRSGYLYVSISAGLLGGFAYFAHSSESSRKDYMKARPGANYDKLYKKYNDTYKMRNILSITYGLWSLYCLYDLNKSNLLVPVIDPANQTASLQLNYHW